MEGTIVIPNTGSACAVIQASNGVLMVVEPLDCGHLELTARFEMGDIQDDFRMRLTNLTTNARVDVIVKRIDMGDYRNETEPRMGRGRAHGEA